MPLPPTPPEPQPEKYDASCEICSVPGARAPTTYPPGTTAPGPPLPSPCTHPHPTGYPSKNIIFLFLYALETSKIRHKLRNLLRSWGPCPYHLPPGTEALGPPPSPSLGVRGSSPSAPPNLHLPPWHRTPPSPSLGPRGGPRGLLSSPFFWNCHYAPPQPSPATKALGLPPCPPGQLRWVPPHPTGHPSKNIIFLLFCTR